MEQQRGGTRGAGVTEGESMLAVRCFEDGAAFLSRYDAFLHSNEAMNSIVLGNTLKSIFNPSAWKFVFMGVEEKADDPEARGGGGGGGDGGVEKGSGGGAKTTTNNMNKERGGSVAEVKVHLCALYFESLQSIFFSAVSPQRNPAGCFDTLARFLHSSRVSVRECQGPVALLNSDADQPKQQHGGIPYFVNLMNTLQSFRMVSFMEGELFTIEDVKPEVFKRKPIGGLRLATPNEQHIVSAWAESFSVEAFGRKLSKEEANETARRNIAEKRVYLWLIPSSDTPSKGGDTSTGKDSASLPDGIRKTTGASERKEKEREKVEEREKIKERGKSEGTRSGDVGENDDDDFNEVTGGREAVAMAMFSKETRNGRTIGWVYTAPQRRKQGYGSGIVAAMSRLALDRGASHCALFTDSSNPTANHIYQDIGYAPQCRFLHYKWKQQ